MKNLNESINELYPILELTFSSEDLLKFKNLNKSRLYLYHYGLGMWIRNNLLNEKEKLYQLFIENNIIHKDKMSSKIIELFHEYLTQEK